VSDDYGHLALVDRENVSHIIITDMDSDAELAKYLAKKQMDARQELERSAALRTAPITLQQ